jgi:outer membrane protein OmpA-like peptidoglycan-associated protein
MRHRSEPGFDWLKTLAVCLMLFLCWGFSPLTVLIKLSMTAFLLSLAGALAMRRRRLAVKVDSSIQLDALPQADFFQPVILVYGNGMDAMFGESVARVSPQGCYVKTDPLLPLSIFAEALVSHRPQWRRQLACLYAVRPELLQDKAAFRAAMTCWRQQITRLQKRLGRTVPLLVSCWLHGPDSPWFVCDSSGVVVVQEDDIGAVSLNDWLTAQRIEEQHTRAALTPALDAALAWLARAVLAELRRPDALNAALQPVAVGIRFLPQPAVTGNLWGKALADRTTLDSLSPPLGGPASSLPFPDGLLPLVAGLTRRCNTWLIPALSTLLLLGFALGAVTLSIFNNQKLITRVGMDLKHYHAIPMASVEPKADAMAVLKQNAVLLECWHRQGEPLRLGLGLYGGESLRLVLQAEIERYIPPLPTSASVSPATRSIPPPSDTPQTVRLDSLALFDTGKFALKPDSAKVLVDALMHIKARPGWLIVVTGHTDSTGDIKTNQGLSHRRAEAVRNWMLATSDVPPTCFAVRGYGASRPIATNDTAIGRAANRRVEISLMPQAEACQAKGAEATSLINGDGLTQTRSSESWQFQSISG